MIVLLCLLRGLVMLGGGCGGCGDGGLGRVCGVGKMGVRIGGVCIFGLGVAIVIS